MLPILVTELGMVRDVRELASKKAQSPILVTELGMERDVRSLSSSKALRPMDVTPGAITTVVVQSPPSVTTPFLMV